MLARHHILQQNPELEQEISQEPEPEPSPGFAPIDRKTCPACKQGVMTFLYEIPRLKRRPFW